MANPRKRSVRRADARQTSKDVRDRERLALLEPGGRPAHPIAVVSASLVEPKARSLPCAVCGRDGTVRVDDHTATSVDGAPLRLAHLRCGMCGFARVLYFTIRPPLLN